MAKNFPFQQNGNNSNNQNDKKEQRMNAINRRLAGKVGGMKGGRRNEPKRS